MIIPIILIVFGLLILGNNFGVINSEVWESLWRFWPVILVILGLGLLARKHIPKWAYLLLVLLIILLSLVGAYYSSGSIKKLNFTQKSDNLPELVIDEPLSSDVSKMNLLVKLGAQDITMDSMKSGLIEGRIVGNGSAPTMRIKQSGNSANVEISQNWTPRAWKFWDKNDKSDSSISLTNQIPTSLDFRVGATKIDANLQDVILSNLSLKAGAFDGAIKLGSRSANTHVDVDTGASNIKFYVPRSAGLNVKQATGLVSVKYTGIEMRSKDGEKEKQSSTFDGSTSKIYVELRAGASSFEFIGY